MGLFDFLKERRKTEINGVKIVPKEYKKNDQYWCFCGEGPFDIRKFNAHLKTHQPLKCEYCEKSFLDPKGLSDHLELHCGFCGLLLDSKEERNHHEDIVHIDEAKEQIQKELHLKDYIRAAGLFHRLKDYDNELKMFLIQIDIEIQRGNYYFALEHLEKAKNVIDKYYKGADNKFSKEVKERVNRLEPYIRNKKELKAKLEDVFGRL